MITRKEPLRSKFIWVQYRKNIDKIRVIFNKNLKSVVTCCILLLASQLGGTGQWDTSAEQVGGSDRRDRSVGQVGGTGRQDSSVGHRL